jgi:hypothetical protein
MERHLLVYVKIYFIHYVDRGGALFYTYPSIERFTKYKKWKNCIDIKSTEVFISILLTCIIVGVFYFLDIYSNFQYFQDSIKNICLYIASSLIGLIGILLTGITFISSLLTEDKRVFINNISKPGSIENILVSFEFLSFISGIQIFEYFITYILLHSPKEIVEYRLFNICTSLSIYFFSFTIFYTISLIGNCVKLHSIVSNIDKITSNKSNIISKANQIRIDFIFKLILKDAKREEFINALENFVETAREG